MNKFHALFYYYYLTDKNEYLVSREKNYIKHKSTQKFFQLTCNKIGATLISIASFTDIPPTGAKSEQAIRRIGPPA